MQVNEIKISYSSNSKNLKPIKINSSESSYYLFRENWDLDTIEICETFKVAFLDNSNNVKGIHELSKGTITSCSVDIRILMSIALKSLSVAMVLCHNHPSGTLRPSQADRSITLKIKKAASLFDIKILDHLIITANNGYFSFADNAEL